MGVPKFYRWTSERYPCLSEVVREYQIPEFDNLYLDMNGIIHLCSHPNDDDPHFRISEEKIFMDIFHYIEILFKMIKPKKVFFMAIDGVAPRAKMNQQRGRRFRSAREAEVTEKKAIERGEILPKEERFDSNCITPGTVFMAKLHEQLKYFVTRKVSTDPMWQNIRVYLSGHETPGEGEHKIMEFIRHEKTQQNYDSNTRHCLYGLDADLMMLGLCSHEIHFSLLREEVRFCGKKAQKRTPTPEETTFHLLHLSLMREYIDHEFSSLKGKLKFEYNIEKIIDDWVLMGFLVGNDFIPHLPHMHIAHDALPMLYKAYIEILPSLDGYINESGYLNLVRFEKYLKQVSQFDYEKFNDTYADLRWFESKTGKSDNGDKQSRYSKKSTKNKDNIFDVLSSIDDDDFQDGSSKDLIDLEKEMTFFNLDSSLDEDEDDDDDDKDEDLFELEFQQHKRDYYINKLEYSNVTTEVLKDQTKCYIHAIQWNLHYYYHGVCSWSWYYPHHYAPYISDVKDFAELSISFDMGKPFLPFEQLLAVLPAASKKLLPAAYQDLMSEKNSPLLEYYPVDFKTDLNGKQQDWEAVVLIPFINEVRLLEAMKPLEDKLTLEEKIRNKHGSCLLYTYVKECQKAYLSTISGTLPDIHFNHARCQEIPAEAFYIEQSKLKHLYKNHISDVYFPGFPSLRHIAHTAELKKAEVKVFQMVSHKDSMILHITPKDNNYNLNKIAKEYVGHCIHVGWPHLIEAKVVAVADETCKFTMILQPEDDKFNEQTLYEEKFDDREADQWRKQCETVRQHYYGRLGIDIGDIQILIFATPLIGRRYLATSSGKPIVEKQWTTQPLKYALQTTIKNLLIHDSLPKPTENIKDLFSPHIICFMMGFPYYGCIGKIVEVMNKRKIRIVVDFTVLEEPDIEKIAKNQHSSPNYMKGYTVAQKLGINSLLLSRITGTFYVLSGSREISSSQKINIGLNLKFNKRNKEVPGYTKKVEDGWLYSSNTLHLLTEYIQMFPELFDYIAHHPEDSTVHIDDIFCDGDSEEKIKEIQNWLKSHPYTKIQLQQCGTDIIDESVVKIIEETVDKIKEINQNERKIIRKQVIPQNLYVPSHISGSLIPDPYTTYKLLDRVVVVREGYSVPIGFRGTVIGIHNAEKELDSMYDIVFDEEFLGGLALRCSPNRGYRLPCFALINLTHGYRQEQQMVKSVQKPTAVVHPQAALQNNNPFSENIYHHGRKSSNYQHSPKSTSSRKIKLPLNKINHSPNSPFVSQQMVSGIKDHNRKSSRNVIEHTSIHSHEKNQVHSESDNEFLTLWKELQKISSGASFSSQDDIPNKRSDDLKNAAKSLESQSFTDNHQWKKNKKNLDTFTKNLDFPCEKKIGNKQAEKEFKSKSLTSNSNKMNISHSTGQSSSCNFRNNNDKTVLSRLLNIDGGAREDSNDNCELDVRPKGNASDLTNESINDTKPISYTYQQPEFHLSHHRFNATWELLKLVQTLFYGSVPVYSYMRSGPQQLIFAQVKLPDQTCYYGHAGLTEEKAGESAALVALHNLKGRYQYTVPVMTNFSIPQVVQPVRPQFPPPFASSAKYIPKNIPNVLRHPPPRAWLENHMHQISYNQDFYRPEFDDSFEYFEKQNVQQSPNRSNQSSSSFHKNFAFDPHLIPMQVTKRSKSSNKAQPSTENSDSAEKHGQYFRANDQASVSTFSSTSGHIDKNTSVSKQSVSSDSHTKSKRKSRLAINFGKNLE